MRLADARLLVEDVPRSVAFYRGVIGLELGVEVPEGVYAELDAGEATLGLYRRDLMQGVVGKEHALGDPGAVVLVFDVGDVDAEHERLKANGAEVVTEPHDQTTWGLRVCHFQDPDGHLIELNHRLGAP